MIDVFIFFPHQMVVKRLVNFNYFCLVTLLILTDLSLLFSSPVPFMELLNGKTSALPREDKGELPSRDPISLLGNQVLPQRKVDETPTLDTTKSLSAVQNNLFNLKSTKLQRNTNLSTARRRQRLELMQLRVSRPSSPSDLNLKSATKQQARGGLPLQSSSSSTQKEPWERLPIRPKKETEGKNGNNPEISVQFSGSGATEDSVGKRPATRRPVISNSNKMPISSGVPQVKLGRMNLKSEWCVIHPFKDIVHHRGCQTAEINNSMCYGQCNSFFIPKKFVSCSYCAPSSQETIKVRLECPGQNPSFVIKKVKIVKECACKDCGLLKQ